MCKSFACGYTYTLVLFLSVSTYGAAEILLTRKTDEGEIKYAFYHEGVTWQQAKERCSSAGTQLLVAEDEAEAKAVREQVDNYTGWAIWIGISDLGRSGSYHTLDGRPVSAVYTNWDKPAGQPDSVGGTLLCAVMWIDAKLYLTNCDWTNFYVCKFPATSNRTTADASHYVKEFFVTLDISSKMKGDFKYHVHKEELTWHQARERCEIAGAQLVVPQDDVEAEAVVYEMHSVTQKWPIWIGISDLKTSGAYETLDGRPISAVHSKWYTYTGQPDSNGGKLRCVLMWTEYFLHVSNCDWPNYYVCKFLVPVKTTAIPTVPEEIACGYKRSNRTESYYRLHDKVAKNWSEAKKICKREGAHLVDLDKVAEFDVLKELFTTNRADNAWIGLAEFGQLRKWMTVQGETFTENNNTLWVPGKSHHSEEVALCGAMLQSGLIDSSNCNMKKKYVCEKLGRKP